MAFCTNCGNKLENEALFCASCGAAVNAPEEQPVEDVAQATVTEEAVTEEAVTEETVTEDAPQEQEICEEQPKEQPSGVYGLGCAIASAVVGFVGFIFSMVSYILGIMGASSYELEYHFSYYGSYYTYAYDEDLAIAAIVFGIIGIIVAIVGVILGIKAIRSFKKGKRLGRNPIGTLIVGIGGLSFAGSGVILSLCGFVLAAACL